MADATKSVLGLLALIRDVCDSLKDQSSLYTSTSSASTSSATMTASHGYDSKLRQTLLVPDLLGISRILVQAGASESMSVELARIHVARAVELAEKYLKAYEQFCFELDDNACLSQSARSYVVSHATRLSELYSNTIQSWKEELVRTVRLRFRARRPQSATHDNKNPAFNYVSISLRFRELMCLGLTLELCS